MALFNFSSTKSLTINGITYAKYELDGDTIYLKVIKLIFDGNESQSEDFIIEIISAIEKRKITKAGFLNV